MNNIKNIIIAAVTALVVVVIAFMVVSRNPVVNNIVTPGENLGAVAGPDMPFPYLRWGTVATFRGSMTMNTATSTICAIRGPAATSTLQNFVADHRVATGTAITATVSVNGNGDTPPSASSTSIVDFGIAASAKQTMRLASSTVIGPNQWVVLTYKGSPQWYPTGTCQASFDEVVPI